MIDKILKSFMWNHHQFRHMTFDELSELYTSIMLRSLAMSMAGIFIPIYLYLQGYYIWQIFLFFAVVFAVNSITAVPISYLIANIGPKHTIFMSYLLQVVAMTGLIFIEHVPSYLLVAGLYGVANTMFFLPFHVDFSKVKHKKSSGSEVSWSYMLDRAGAVFGPVIGGFVAYFFGAKYTFAVAIIALLLGAVPLLLTKEPVRLHQKLDFKKLKLSSIKRDLISQSFFTLEASISMIVWPFFIGLYVFHEHPYVQIGIITSISITISIIVARVMGKVVDNKKGRVLLRFSTVANAVLHLVRPFTSGFMNALAVNIANDSITPGYRMPYLKGWYDAADDHPGARIVYMTAIEVVGTISRGAFFTGAAIASYYLTTGRAFFGVLFFIGAVSSLLIMLERYPALNPKRHWYAKR